MKICCLPVAGGENPYQRLMMTGLRSDERLEVRHGVDGKLFAALRSVMRHGPDVIHYDWIHRYFLRRHRLLTWIHAPVFVLELMIVRYVFGCRLVWTMHNLLTHDQGGGRTERWVRRRFAGLCEWVRVFDETTVERARLLLDIPEHAFRVLPEGSYVGCYRNDVDRASARQALGLEPGTFVLLFLGQIRPYKGIEELLASFRATARRDWRLVIAGMPLDEAYCRNLRAEAAEIDGARLVMEYIPDENLQVFFQAADVVVLPFKKVENSGSAILAMGFGKPVVAPRLGVLSSRLAQQDDLLYEPGTLTHALGNLKSLSAGDLQEIGARNLAALDAYSWDAFAGLFSFPRAR
jgi:glycosyltransferase involved in cell wall biosynthesis